MFQLAYTSKANQAFLLDELTELSNDAGMRNRKIDVTGMLVHHDGTFFQFLEGNELVIKALYKRISQDSRHTNCKIIYTQESNTRMFSNWFTRYLSFEYIREITGEELSEDFEELLAGKIENKDEVMRIVNKLTSIVSSHHSD
ncbi:MAG: BLUF domain-containing protein [Pseudomonadales bacterium]|nr:BLUF domain-containing protein [Pseudomonadales bacterium]